MLKLVKCNTVAIFSARFVLKLFDIDYEHWCVSMLCLYPSVLSILHAHTGNGGAETEAEEGG